MLDPAIGHLIVQGVALLFATAGVHKLRGLAAFTEVVAGYRVLPQAIARRTAWLIPCAELAIAAGLAAERNLRATLVAAIGLLLGYAAAIAWNLVRGRRDLDCGCGSHRNRRPIAAWMVWRNMLLAAALGLAALPWSRRTIGLTDLLTLGGGLAASAMLYMAIDGLLAEIAAKSRAMRGMAIRGTS